MKNRRNFFARAAFLGGALLFGLFTSAPAVWAGASAGSYTWTNISTTDTATHGMAWNALGTSASGQRLVAGVYLGDVWTSSDYGATWTDTSVANPAMQGQNWIVASNASGEHLAAEAYNGDIWTSSDYGATWTDVSTGHAELTYKHWFSLNSDSTGKYLVATILGGDIYTSGDYGTTWTDRTPSGGTHNQMWQSVVSDSTGQRLAGVVRDGDIWTSSDYGVTWTNVSTANPATSGLEWWYLASNSTGQRLSALTHNGDIWTSSDYGATWANASATTATATHGLNWDVVTLSATGKYQAATASGNGVWTSSDYGATWAKEAATAGLNWSSARLSGDGRHLVAEVGGGDIWTGVNPAIADSSTLPNSGDTNGDGTMDYAQENIAGSVNPVTGQYALAEAGSGCTVSGQNVVSATQDAGYSYPAGLMNFTVQGCGANGFTTTVTQYYYNLPSSGYVLRKYNPTTKTYSTISGATFSHAVIGGQNVVKVSYQVTDGGALDEDGAVNGVIVDPAGLALATSASLVDTGYNTTLVAVFAGVLIVAAVAVRRSVRKQQ